MSAESLCATNARRARRAVEDGQYKKATQALTSVGLAQASPEIFAKMLVKYPQGDLPLIPQDPFPAPVKINEAEVVKALRSFPTGTAPGPSALRANHLKEAVFCPSPDRAYTTLQVLSRVINLLCSGQVPSDVVPHLCGAILFACKKKGGGLRPIAVGEVLRRMTSKCISRAVQGEAFKALTPLQVGVGVPVGCEAIVQLYTLLTMCRRIPTSSLRESGHCSWTFPTLSTASAARRCSRKLDPIFLLWLPGSSAAMVPAALTASRGSHHSQLLWCSAR